MAYMSQDHKKEINVLLKNIIPKTWKWSLSVRHHSAIVLTVFSGPKSLMIDSDGLKLMS